MPVPLDWRTLLLTALLLLIGTPIADSLRLLRAFPPEGLVDGAGTFLENGLNMQVDWGAAYRPWTTSVCTRFPG